MFRRELLGQFCITIEAPTRREMLRIEQRLVKALNEAMAPHGTHRYIDIHDDREPYPDTGSESSDA